MGVIAGNSKSEQLLDFVRETFRTLKVAPSDLGLWWHFLKCHVTLSEQKVVLNCYDNHYKLKAEPIIQFLSISDIDSFNHVPDIELFDNEILEIIERKYCNDEHL